MKTTLTEQQKKIRLSKFSGSEIYKLMGVKGMGKTGLTYITEKAAESITGQSAKEEFSAASTSWGCDYEKEAGLYFEAATGLKVSTDEITLSNNFICGTPDGLILNEKIGFEIKCPYNSGNHLKNLLMENQDDLKALHPEYYWQCVAYMWLTDFERWKFCSYDPRFPDGKKMLILNLQLIDKDLILMQKRVTEARFEFDNIISKLK